MENILNLSLTQLENNGITPNEYIYLYYLINEKTPPNYPIDLKNLQDKKLIKETDSGIIIRPNGKKLFDLKEIQSEQESFDQKWLKFKQVYPQKYQSRRLHCSTAIGKEKLRKILNKKEATIDDIIKGIEIEWNLRKKAAMKGEFFEAPQNMQTYLNQRTWEKYLDEDIEDKEDENNTIIG